MMTPPPCSRMCGTKAWAVRKTDFTLTAKTRSNSRVLDLHQRLVAVGRAGVVDHDVDAPEGLDRRFGRPLDVVAVRHVGAKRDRPGVAEPFGGRLGDVGF